MSFWVSSLASGSSGNAFLLEGPEGLALVDAGISGKSFDLACRRLNADPGHLRAIILTHDHGDHVSGAGVLARRHQARLCMSAGAWEGVSGRIGPVSPPCFARDGQTLRAAGISFTFHSTPHDAKESLAVVAERDGRRCGFFTDLGHPFKRLGGWLETLDAVFLESNYSEPLLEANPQYPPWLKKRIRGAGGHLENREAGRLLRDHARPRLRWVALSHLSKENNNPGRAMEEVLSEAKNALDAAGTSIFVAPRAEPTAFMGVGNGQIRSIG